MLEIQPRFLADHHGHPVARPRHRMSRSAFDRRGCPSKITLPSSSSSSPLRQHCVVKGGCAQIQGSTFSIHCVICRNPKGSTTQRLSSMEVLHDESKAEPCTLHVALVVLHISHFISFTPFPTLLILKLPLFTNPASI